MQQTETNISTSLIGSPANKRGKGSLLMSNLEVLWLVALAILTQALPHELLIYISQRWSTLRLS